MIVVLCCTALQSAFGADSIEFNRDVRSLLSNNCFHCHGPDEEDRQADIRLDVSGHADLKEVLIRITSSDPTVIMPPPESNKRLSDRQIEVLKRWISEGAEYEQHWSFTPLTGSQIPAGGTLGQSDHPIDRFVSARLQREGLHPSRLSDRRTQIRRLTLDLTGLPPTLDEISEFEKDSSERAYERLVDRLLSKPQYGEHMARYWLDLVRFADTNGRHHDHFRQMSPYRDWVIRAFNDNLSFDDFIRYQVAGDLYEQPTTDQLIASGFNRLHLIIDVGTALPEESFHRNVVDRVTAFGTAFLGLTLHCAECHDHKYDPLSQKEFYQLYAFFNNFDGGPETGRRGTMDFKRGLQIPYLELPSRQQQAQLREIDRELNDVEENINAVRARAAAYSQHLDDEVEDKLLSKLQQRRERLDRKRAILIRQIPAALVMKERATIRPTHVRIRGAYDAIGELVKRDTPKFLPPSQRSEEFKTRLDLANWLVARHNPLTARVAANRLWQQFFGIGLVKTSEDLGAQGEVPSHPELLDYLAMQFVDSGWDVKKLVRLIVLSNTYRQCSKATPTQYAADPENRLLGRGSRFRLDAEVIRDQTLAVSGLLNQQMFGPSVKPPQPPGLWKLVSMPTSNPYEFQADEGENIYRRSIYTFWKRSLPPPPMSIFDAPTREVCVARRERTNTPLQALVLMNEPQFFTAAVYYASRLMQLPNLTDHQRVERAYQEITSQIPSSSTMDNLINGLKNFRELYCQSPQRVEQVLGTCEALIIPGIGSVQERTELVSLALVVHSLLNLDSTKTRL